MLVSLRGQWLLHTWRDPASTVIERFFHFLLPRDLVKT